MGSNTSPGQADPLESENESSLTSRFLPNKRDGGKDNESVIPEKEEPDLNEPVLAVPLPKSRYALTKRSSSSEYPRRSASTSAKKNVIPITRSYSTTFFSKTNDQPTVTGNQDKPISRLRASKLQIQNFWNYICFELLANDTVPANPIKEKHVENFLATPYAIEKTFLFGWFVSVDSFLYIFTLFPIRVLISFFTLSRCIFQGLFSTFFHRNSSPNRSLPRSRKIDLLKLLLIFSTSILIRKIDVSRLYHIIRAQASIRFYVLYNVLEIADRLCCALGQDVLDCLFSNHILSFNFWNPAGWMTFFYYFAISLAYMVLHTLVLLYQIITLNVTVNSYSNAVLALLMSNQLVEIKGAVFKKFEKENLFQLTCSDVVERFQITIMVIIIFLRNLAELYTTSSLDQPLLTFKRLKTLLAPFFWVIGSELFVDWLKHAFIIKFNYIKPSIYSRFTDVLCHDYVASGAQLTQVSYNTLIIIFDNNTNIGKDGDGVFSTGG